MAQHERLHRAERGPGAHANGWLSMSDDYRDLLRRLAGLDAEAAAHRDEAVRWHDDRVARAAQAVRSAEEDVRAAAQDLRQAERRREAVDARAALLWAEFTSAVGSRAERFGS